MPREQIAPKKGSKRYVRRTAKGRFTEGQGRAVTCRRSALES
jgi:hypothetical protein